MTKPCKAVRKNGLPCQAPAGASGFCFGHDPELAEARRAGSRRGGQHKTTERRAEKLMPGGLAQIAEILRHTIAGTLQDRIDPRKATAVASLSGVYVRCYQVSVVEAEQAELAARLERLEEVNNARRAF
jgi:hypothetical protein